MSPAGAPTQPPRLRVAILGSGNIGTDLLVKVLRSELLECALFIGRNADSPGMRKAKSLGVPTSDRSLDAILDDPGRCDLVFDATSARDHLRHAPALERLGKMVVDLTPSRVGRMTVPAVDADKPLAERNVNMVSCGGQASIPVAHLIGEIHPEVEYVEVVSSISSKSAGPATRLNLDEYIETTEAALESYSGCRRAKTILILNPAEPCINMQATISAKVPKADLDALIPRVEALIRRIQTYVPGYQLIGSPVFETNRIVVMVRVTGRGDYLPTFAGNLDIINCAAIATAERYARQAALASARR
jgi:acetaldehyde dehydrogenase